MSCQRDVPPDPNPGLILRHTHLVPDGSGLALVSASGDTSRYVLSAFREGDPSDLRTITRLERDASYRVVIGDTALALETQADTLSEHVLNYNVRQGWHLYNDPMSAHYLED